MINVSTMSMRQKNSYNQDFVVSIVLKVGKKFFFIKGRYQNNTNNIK